MSISSLVGGAAHDCAMSLCAGTPEQVAGILRDDHIQGGMISGLEFSSSATENGRMLNFNEESIELSEAQVEEVLRFILQMRGDQHQLAPLSISEALCLLPGQGRFKAGGSPGLTSWSLDGLEDLSEIRESFKGRIAQIAEEIRDNRELPLAPPKAGELKTAKQLRAHADALEEHEKALARIEATKPQRMAIIERLNERADELHEQQQKVERMHLAQGVPDKLCLLAEEFISEHLSRGEHEEARRRLYQMLNDVSKGKLS